MMKPLFIASTLLLSGCSFCYPPAPIVPVATAAPVITPAPVTPAVKPAAVNGVARYFGNPLPGATVEARPLGQTRVVGTATTHADGRFAMDLDASVAPGTLIQFIATGDGHRVASVGRAPRPRQLLQETELVLDEAQSAALLVLAPRLFAAMETGSEAAADEAYQTFLAAAQQLGSTSASLPRDRFDAAVNAVLDNQGQLMPSSTQSREQVLAIIPQDQVPNLVRQADHLADVIRQAVLDGGKRPAETLVGALVIGDQEVAKVFDDTNQIEITGAEDNNPPIPVTAEGGLGVVDGTVVDTTATGTLSVVDD
jgi:hypothetical protein